MNKMTCLAFALALSFGVSAHSFAALKYEKKDYYVELARTKTDISTSFYGAKGSGVDGSSLRATELRMGYFVMPDFSVELRYDNGDKIDVGNDYKFERKASYGLYAKKQAELASGFGDNLSINGYVMLGLANNNQTMSLYGNEFDKQNKVGVHLGVGLTFEIKRTVYLNVGLTTRGNFDGNSVINSTRHRSLDVGLGVKF